MKYLNEVVTYSIFFLCILLAMILIADAAWAVENYGVSYAALRAMLVEGSLWGRLFTP